MTPTSKKRESRNARKKRYLDERRGSYNQINNWNPELDELDTCEEIDAPSNRCLVMKHHVVIVCLLLLMCCLSIGVTLSYGWSNSSSEFFHEQMPQPSPVLLKKFNRAAIVVDADECAEIGFSMLDRNGSAVDAAIAALLCIGVVNTQSAGIGGGLMMTLYDPDTRQARVLIGRETAPAAATKDMYVNDPLSSQLGWKAVGVPGEVAAYWQAHQKYGVLPWKTLFEPTIALCRQGYKINAHQAAKLVEEKDKYINDPVMRSLFINASSGLPYSEGHVIHRPVLADTLQAVADGGAAEFYNGSVARRLVDDIRNNGGIITQQDLSQYRARWVEPVVAQFDDGSRMFSVPPPGSGSVLALIMQVLDGYNYSRPQNLDSQYKYNLMYHRISEAFKFAFAKRAEIADPMFVNISQLMSQLQSPTLADQIRAKIDDTRTFGDPTHYGARGPAGSDSGTSHVSAVDTRGVAVAVTSTVNLVFGAHVISPSTGVLLNDQMDDFSTPGVDNYFGLPPSDVNFIEPGKMMVSSMCPSIFVAEDGQVRLVTGAAGGSRIITATAYSAFRHLMMGEDLKKANDAPRLHHQLYPMILHYNQAFPQESVRFLRQMGHDAREWSRESVVPMVARVQNQLHAVMDHRKHAGDARGF